MNWDDIIRIWTQPGVVRLLGIAVLSIVLWRIPLVRLLVYPFWLLNTFIHEMSHGFAAVFTGGRLHAIVIHPNRSGIAHVQGGNMFVTTNAGYLGSAVVGAGLLFLTATSLGEATVLLLLGIGLAVLCLIFVRNLFGFVAGLALASGLTLASLYLPPAQTTPLLQFLAVQLALASLDSVLIVTRAAFRREPSAERSDAHVLARMTGIPALIWALLWSLCSLALVFLAITSAYHQGITSGLP